MNGSNDNVASGTARRMSQGIDVVSEPSAHSDDTVRCAPAPVDPDRDKRIGEDDMD